MADNVSVSESARKLDERLFLLRQVYPGDFCCNFESDFRLLIHVIEGTKYDCSNTGHLSVKQNVIVQIKDTYP